MEPKLIDQMLEGKHLLLYNQMEAAGQFIGMQLLVCQIKDGKYISLDELCFDTAISDSAIKDGIKEYIGVFQRIGTFYTPKSNFWRFEKPEIVRTESEDPGNLVQLEEEVLEYMKDEGIKVIEFDENIE